MNDSMTPKTGLLPLMLELYRRYNPELEPDFDGGRIVMGHMGESNPAIGTRTILRRKKFAFGEALDPVVADVTMPEGERATVVNLGFQD